MASATNGILSRALDLLRPRRGRAGLTSDEANLVRRVGLEQWDGLGDEERDRFEEEEARRRLLQIGRSVARNRRPPRPRTALTDRIAERRALERERKAAMNEAWAVVVEARGEVVAASRAHPEDPDREERAAHALREAEMDWRETERAWRRARSGRHALQLAEDRLLGLREYEEGLKRREKRRAGRR